MAQVEIARSVIARRGGASARPHQEGIARIVIQRMRPGVGYQRLKAFEHSTAVLHLESVVCRSAVVSGERKQSRRSIAGTADLAADQPAAFRPDVSYRDDVVRAQRLIQSEIPLRQTGQLQIRREGVA